jgi:signal peptide peptidase SppA
MAVLDGRFSGAHEFDAKIATTIKSDAKERGYEVEHEVGIIPVSGTLVHKNGYVGPYSGVTGYDSIRHSFTMAMSDPKVKAIALDIDSPGGEVAGCFDLCDMIYRSRGVKPIMAIVSEVAFSAAYAIASAADIITVPVCGGTGSVGVVACHADYSQRLENEGVKVTMIHYGAKKIDGNEAFPLSDSALGRLQSDVDKMGEMFVRRVARNRGMSVKAVRDTQAGIYMGKDGVDIGFADEVLAPEHAFEALVDSIS